MSEEPEACSAGVGVALSFHWGYAEKDPGQRIQRDVKQRCSYPNIIRCESYRRRMRFASPYGDTTDWGRGEVDMG
ncbi:hypothetical protein RRG08_042235 [Elysia crispata]|uniref:Uncharacterized protein n=1 Tax=Elysia crispata TaxID=231223 RepID=A0AAE1E439_9GAST|nr:hypothetical protein RRG08_042235 [Elysia crispata]